GVRDPRVLHAARGAARDAYHAPRPVLGRRLRGCVEPRRRSRRTRAAKARRRRRTAAPPHPPRRRLRPRRAGAVSWLRSLRARLTALFLVIAGAAILGAAVLMSSVLEHAVWGPLDAELTEEIETLCTLVAAGQLEGMQAATAAIATEIHHGPGKFMRVMGPGDVVIAEAGRVPEFVRNAPVPDARSAQTVSVRNDAMR